jgi:general secretion pathway protein I
VRGFTLLEMLVAIAIIGVIGASVSTAVGGVANQTRTLEQRTVASWIASNHLTRMRLLQRQSPRSLRAGKDQSLLVFADREWEVETQIHSTDHPWMQRIEIKVFAIDDIERQRPIGQLSGFLGQY